jgi:hypothetical protein
MKYRHSLKSKLKRKNISCYLTPPPPSNKSFRSHNRKKSSFNISKKYSSFLDGIESEINEITDVKSFMDPYDSQEKDN